MSTQKFKRKYIKNSDPGKIMDLIMRLTDETCAKLQMKINLYLMEECEAETVFQIVIFNEPMEFYIEAVGTGNLFGKKKLETCDTFVHAFKTRLTQSELLEDFNSDLQSFVLPRIRQDNAKKRVVLFPVRHNPFSVFFGVVAPAVQEEHVALIVHECAQYTWPTIKKTIALEYEIKRKQKCQQLLRTAKRFFSERIRQDNAKKRVVLFPVRHNPFSVFFGVVAPAVQEEHVALIVHECAQYTWPTIKKTIALEYEIKRKQKCQQLLRTAKRFFSEVTHLSTLLTTVMDQAKLLIKSEYCFLMLVDPDKMELYYVQNRETNEVMDDQRFPVKMGIPGEVIKTGTLLNTRNLKSHPAYSSIIDDIPDIECRNLLCFPIREQSGIIGVVKLINKVDEPYFDSLDEEMALAFSVYCGVCITHSVLFKKIQEAHVRGALSNELALYYMKVTDAEVDRIMACKAFHDQANLDSIFFNSRVIALRELPCYVFKMFKDLGLVARFQINHVKLYRFILLVRRGYRDVPYHNWQHAFNVTQWSYAAIVTYKLLDDGYLNDLQILVFMLAALMHDLDHRGSAMVSRLHGTVLASMYSSEGSVMERHHLSQALCILNTEGCDILEMLPRKDYDMAIMMLRDFIVASDLSTFMRDIIDYRTVALNFHKGNRRDQSVLCSLLMNAADLSDHLKDWQTVKNTAVSILTEFLKLNEMDPNAENQPATTPSFNINIEKALIPTIELQFLEEICEPVYEILAKILPAASVCVQVIRSHMERWDASLPVFAEVTIPNEMAVLLSMELDHLIDLYLKEKEEGEQEEEEEEGDKKGEKKGDDAARK